VSGGGPPLKFHETRDNLQGYVTVPIPVAVYDAANVDSDRT